MQILSTFTKYVLPDVPGCPPLLAERELLSSVQEFCEDTWILNADLTASIETTDIDSTDNYSVDVNISGSDDSVSVFPILFPVAFGGMETLYKPFALDGFTIDGVKKDLIYYQNVVHNQYLPVADVKYFYFKSNIILTFFPFSAACEIWTKLIYKPLPSADQLDDLFYYDYLDPIISNLRSRLYNMPGKVWTNPAAAQIEYNKYKRYVSKVRRKKTNNFQNISSHVQWRTFGE